MDWGETLRGSGLRTTRPRLAILRELERNNGVASYVNLVESLGRLFDQSTIYRNLIKLARHSILVEEPPLGEALLRYRLECAGREVRAEFWCRACRRTFEPEGLEVRVEPGPWERALASARPGFIGVCPSCFESNCG